MAGGFISHVTKTLQQNRALLKKRKIRKKGDVYGQDAKTKLNLRESTEQDMKIIRKKIKEYKREELRITLVSVITTLTLIYFLYVWLFV